MIYKGIPKINDYQNIMYSEMFLNMETFANKFVEDYRKCLYNYPWVKDSLHHWSRQYEYPYVFYNVSSFIRNSKIPHCKILDAGSGVTFFPYYIKESFQNTAVVCCDQEVINKDIFKDINDNFQNKISFNIEDLRETNYHDCSFDIIYCISVLEHTEDYEKIIKEFKRILKPSGKLILTFDICIKGDDDISPERAERLLNILYTEFPPKNEEDKIILKDELNSTDLLTTDYVATVIPSSVHQHSLIKLIPLLKSGLRVIISENLLQKVISCFQPGLRKEIREKLSFFKRPGITNITICCGEFYRT